MEDDRDTPQVGRRAAPRVDRRTVLKAGGTAFAGLVGGVLASACSSPPDSHGAGGTTSTRATGSPPTTAHGSVPPTTANRGAPDWPSLARSMDGRLLLPSSPQYATLAPPYNPVFDDLHPQALAYVSSAVDVQSCIAFARHYGVPISIRSGGHSYGGWSTGPGLVIDVSQLNSVSVNGHAVAVGAGTRLVDLYGRCAPAGLAVPGGSCPSVGIAGLALGGGLGVLDRKLGLTCDAMTNAEVVLADGTIVDAAAGHSDLLWALRGGGGGNFGVVTRFGFEASSIGELAIFTLVWPWSAAERVVSVWQQWAPHAPDELWSNCLLLASQNTPSGEAPVARVTGVYVGSEGALESELAHLLNDVPTSPFTHFVGTADLMQTMLIEAGCDGDTVAECHLPSQNPAGVLSRAPFAAKSDIATSPLTAGGISALLAAVLARQTSPVLSGGGVALDAAGGAIARVAPTATAFVHRNALFTMQYSANWQPDASASIVDANNSWLASAWSSMRPYVSGQAYQNYADPSLPNWAQAYYGENLPRLQQVKATYDPDDVFRFAQSIPLT